MRISLITICFVLAGVFAMGQQTRVKSVDQSQNKKATTVVNTVQKESPKVKVETSKVLKAKPVVSPTTTTVSKEIKATTPRTTRTAPSNLKRANNNNTSTELKRVSTNPSK